LGKIDVFLYEISGNLHFPIDKEIMTKNNFSKILPHVVALLLFIVISFAYFTAIIEGKQMVGHDTQSWRCMANETITYNESHDSPTLWTDAMFGGMPNYQISMTQPNNWIQYVEKVISVFPNTIDKVMLYLICFYILLLAFGVNPWMAMVGSVAFTFASYNFIIIAAGHNSKAITIAYMAPLIGSVFLAFRNKKILGAILTALFLSLAIRANHVQILYYTLIILGVLGIVELIYSIKDKTLASYLKSIGWLAAAALIAVGMNATTLLTTYEYSQYTMRGKSNGLTSDTQNSQHGLNPDYITQWSYGVGETMTLLIPDFYGGASAGNLSADSETGKKIATFNVPSVDDVMKQMKLPLYWGDQPGTSGPVYLGAVVLLLFVLGLFIVDKKIKWWLVPVIILTIMLSWGKNFMGLTNFFIEYMPMYNKFRTVSMTLVAAGFGITLIALLALKKILDPSTDKKLLLKPLFISAGIVGGIALIFALIPSLAGSFTSSTDAQQFKGDYSFLLETVPLDRKALLRADAWRSVAFVLLSAGVVWLYIKNYLKANLVIAAFGVLFLADLVPVCKRYLNNDNFQEAQVINNSITPSKADNYILQDKSDYRVLDATTDMFNDATPSYFHKNVGGYHAAKLRRYQELINMQIMPELQQLFAAFGHTKTMDQLNPTLDSLGVLNMLNMKYIIYNKETAPITNPYTNGTCWLVKNIRVAADANEEMKLTGEINTKTDVVVDKSLAGELPAKLTPDTSARISLTTYEPNRLLYKYSSKSEQVAVFSEIFYDKGWVAVANGKELPIVRVNYLLRALKLEPGQYDIEFRFDPKSYSIGNTLSLISSVILVLAVLGYIVFLFIKRRDEFDK